jgi:hypothetical protein
MAQLNFGGHGGTIFPKYFNPNIFFQADSNNPTPAIPSVDVPVFLFASVTNAGKQVSICTKVRETNDR